MAMRMVSILAGCFLGLGLCGAAMAGDVFEVGAFGAVGDGAARDTAAIQKAIDACGAAGGGRVLFPAGCYFSSSLHLRSGVELHLAHGARLLGSPVREEYDRYEQLDFENDADAETGYFHHALIWGEDLEAVAVTGSGVIDSNFRKRRGPKTIALKRCRQVRILDIKIVNSPNYAISPIGCEEVLIDGVTIRNGYCDGIDPDSCANVRIANCDIETIDDAIVPKASFSLGELRPCQNITVTNCILSTVCNGFKLGTESGGGFRQVAVSNCVIRGFKDHRPAISGIALESVDGGVLEDVVVTNITMVDVRAPIFIRLGNRGRDMATPKAGALRNIIISNVTARRASLACGIAGIPGHRIQGVQLSNIQIDYAGANPRHPADRHVEEWEARYPEALMFGALPAYGFFCRHVEDLSLRGVRVGYRDGFWRLTTDQYRDIVWPGTDAPPSHSAPGEAGHALYAEDVSGLHVDGFAARPSQDGNALLRFNNVSNALITGCTVDAATRLFVEGVACEEIHLEGNTLGQATAPQALQP